MHYRICILCYAHNRSVKIHKTRAFTCDITTLHYVKQHFKTEEQVPALHYNFNPLISTSKPIMIFMHVNMVNRNKYVFGAHSVKHTSKHNR